MRKIAQLTINEFTVMLVNTNSNMGTNTGTRTTANDKINTTNLRTTSHLKQQWRAVDKLLDYNIITAKRAKHRIVPWTTNITNYEWRWKLIHFSLYTPNIHHLTALAFTVAKITHRLANTLDYNYRISLSIHFIARNSSLHHILNYFLYQKKS